MRIRLKWGDIVIISIVLLMSLGLAGLMLVQNTGTRLYAEILIDGELLERVPLNEGTYKTINAGGHNIIVIEDGTAKIDSADCHDQVCVRTGRLTRSGQAAVCLPNKVVLRITGEDSEVDAVAS